MHGLGWDQIVKSMSLDAYNYISIYLLKTILFQIIGQVVLVTALGYVEVYQVLYSKHARNNLLTHERAHIFARTHTRLFGHIGAS